MKAAGIDPGGYHYGHPGTSAMAQAQYFVNRSRPPGGLVRLQLAATGARPGDHRRPVAPRRSRPGSRASCAEIKTLTGKPGIIYTGYYFWRDSAGNPTNNLQLPALDRRLRRLLAHGPRRLAYWTFWQYCDTGSVPGVSGDVDLDYFNGTLTNLKSLTFP